MRRRGGILPCVSLLAACLGAIGCGSDARELEESRSAAHAAAEPSPPEPIVECTDEGASCTRHGQTGRCLRERCVLPSGACSYDVDCLDGNECSETRCNAGGCEVRYLEETSCEDGAGLCRGGSCARPEPASCERDRECKASARTCASASCVEGACVFEVEEDGTTCRLPSQLPGRCSAGECVVREIRTDRGERCRVVRGPYGPMEQCTRRTRFGLGDEEIEEEAAKIAKRIHENVLYDVDVRLVPLADGGNNILVFNRHARTDVRGLVDPSFVAFEIASYTEQSDWKSRMLHVWLDPYEDGWQISTRGGRKAVKRGREASILGGFGVVDIKSFRSWLQRSFTALPRPAPERLEP
jgi:hypothetical protein